ncbi:MULTISPECIES: pyrroloquinoline quinone biosynthesis protein PqqB [Nitrospirillum]|uniref:Coenzyme PQQ synthesis protein B n=1 Tax=Nitrospirillum amazonense TaxID=28077 RepID=A0A560G6V5_9PROT|nr:pyrroloquinoline quinone biosynthesis protein PqqB [Nitrospirillum amazonense]MEC4593171.1 pyrroloquinoline quinone biosynthesis protein PqqB [Nitrospirillum amazonense]TWB29622.1 pyrroloquinoline quinone biosynthesis protein B [Nitrospirillum amazonense]
MHILVLGAAAGGGFPQWNSHAEACRRARAGDPAVLPRTQASLAVSRDGRDWFLLNASPDLRQQIAANPALHPSHGLRSSPIAGVVLSGGDVDVIAGLLNLRERQPFTLHGTARTLGILDANPIFEVLARDVVARSVLPLNERVPLTGGGIGGAESGLWIELFPVPGKVPLYLEGHDGPPPIEEGEDTVGVAVDDGERRFFFIPGCAAMTAALADRLRGAELVFFDGTLYTDTEMIDAGLGKKTGLRMGHMSVDATLAAFAGLDVHRQIFIHINNSNPILMDDSPQRRVVDQAGWEVAFDGMEIAL